MCPITNEEPQYQECMQCVHNTTCEKSRTFTDVIVDGKEERWPTWEYLDYKAYQFGFDDYEDMVKKGLSLRGEEDITNMIKKELMEEKLCS